MESKTKLVKTADGKNYLVPFILVTTLFFLWGFAHSILDVLNKHFQDSLDISKAGSALVQTMVYGSYFIMALPVGKLITKHGYRAGVLVGLVLYGIGSLMFIPGNYLQSFPFFLFSLFIIGCGIACLETSANPYATVLGDMKAAERRINLAQSFNGMGWICGPLVGGIFLFSDNSEDQNIAIPYTIIGIVVLLVALFLYVAAQTGINSFFINYMTDHSGIAAREASLWLSFGGMGLFMLGRMGGSLVMKFFRSDRLLAICAVVAAIAMLVAMIGYGMTGVYAFFVCYLCESIMFPTIFALSIKGVGGETKKASSYLIMTIVGGAFAPLVMGYIADNVSITAGFSVPFVCFIGISVYAALYRKLK
ncbi:MAG: MFS transporter [Prevotellaceae bacterium]|nr:MFS transporter [Prevotellaceae bacterium]